LYKAHIFLGLLITILFPFTRLVHMISGFAAPFRYLLRPGYQIVRSRRQTALPKRRATATPSAPQPMPPKPNAPKATPAE